MALVNPSTPLASPVSPIDELSPLCGTDVIGKEETEEGNGRYQVVKEAATEAPGVLEAGDETKKPWIEQRPALPLKALIYIHFPLHLNYRSWCRHCVAGRAMLAQDKGG